MLTRPAIIRSPPAAHRRLDRAERAHVVGEALRLAGLERNEADECAASVARAGLRPAAMEQLIDRALSKSRGLPMRGSLAAGALDRRFLLIPGAGERAWIASLSVRLEELFEGSGRPEGIELGSGTEWVREAVVGEAAYRRLSWPHVKLVSLYHPENFPLPRFALGISDIARSLRKQMIGRVSLCDMQLGPTAEAVVAEIERDRPDIVGISSTFGQHDVFERVLQGIRGIAGYAPLIVAGGSLAALNADHLARRGMLVALGPGELTMSAVVRFFLGEIPATSIPAACFVDDDGQLRRTPEVSNRLYDDILPELDLVEATLDAGGVTQLESSRGCSYSCSFCPRGHKGIWAGEAAEALDAVLPDIAGVYDERPAVARKLFLVDEEYFGYRPEAAERAEGVASMLARHGFRFETSSRVDQVCRPTRGPSWHHERMKSWRKLVETGLDRCLFGVESGVDSILERFNKKTSSQQNVLAIRTLTALGVPIRCTYITFDPLMSMDELRQTHEFLGRSDLILKPQPGMQESELHDAVRDEDWVKAHSAGRPFYAAVSYMLVSMECLIGSPYLKLVQQRGLAGATNLNMGRREARYSDERIGMMSYWSQSWIDRNFSLDYLLKSLEKVTGGEARAAVRGTRALLKASAYDLLSDMLAGAGAADSHRAPSLLDRNFDFLRSEMALEIDLLLPKLEAGLARRLAEEHERWRGRSGWEHINAA
ncbi:MAG TPA: cobalamin-dependent protein [Allosphingosinicella sp.]